MLRWRKSRQITNGETDDLENLKKKISVCDDAPFTSVSLRLDDIFAPALTNPSDPTLDSMGVFFYSKSDKGGVFMGHYFVYYLYVNC